MLLLVIGFISFAFGTLGYVNDWSKTTVFLIFGGTIWFGEWIILTLDILSRPTAGQKKWLLLMAVLPFFIPFLYVLNRNKLAVARFKN